MSENVLADSNVVENARGQYFYHYCFAASFIFWMFVHHVVSPIYFTRWNKIYKELDWVKRMEWDSKFISTIHSVVVSIMCLYILITESELWLRPIDYPSDKSLIVLTISLGYFLCDSVSMLMYWWNFELFIYLLHHGCALIAFGSVTIHRSLVFFGIFRLLTEMSTPFANQRWFYRVMGYQPSKRRVASVTLIFSLLFVLTRNILAIPYWIYVNHHYGTKAHLAILKSFPTVTFVWIVNPIILDILNIYWSKRVYKIGWLSYKCVRQAEWMNDLKSVQPSQCLGGWPLYVSILPWIFCWQAVNITHQCIKTSGSNLLLQLQKVKAFIFGQTHNGATFDRRKSCISNARLENKQESKK